MKLKKIQWNFKKFNVIYKNFKKIFKKKNPTKFSKKIQWNFPKIFKKKMKYSKNLIQLIWIEFAGLRASTLGGQSSSI